MFKVLKDHLIPHKGNGHSPLLFAAESIATILFFVLLLQMVFVMHTALVRNTDFFAAVLPSVLITMTNTDRAEAGVSALERDALLTRAAQAKANDMARYGYFAHVDPNGRQPWYWLEAVGYQYSYAGENLAMDFSESAEVEEAWMASPAHKANIMKGKFTKVGIGIAKGEYQGKETMFVVQFFATPPPITIITEQVTQEPPRTLIALEQEADMKVLGAQTDSRDIAARQGEISRLESAPEPNETVILISEQVSANTAVYKGNKSVITRVQDKFAELATSPSHWIVPLLIGIFAVLGSSFVVAYFVHIKVQYVEGLATAMFLLVIIASLVHFNAGATKTVQIPEINQQYASVIKAF